MYIYIYIDIHLAYFFQDLPTRNGLSALPWAVGVNSCRSFQPSSHWPAGRGRVEGYAVVGSKKIRNRPVRV